MHSSHDVNSPTCFGTPHVPSSGTLCSCYHNAFKWSVVTNGERIHSYALEHLLSLGNLPSNAY